MARYRVTIIGAGIVGSCIARVLSKYENLEVYLLEKEVDVGWGASKANTSIIHPGHEDDPDKYPLRAKLCVRGNRLWHRWVKELEIPAEFPGELMVALSEEDLKTCEYYLRLAIKNGVPGVRLVYRDELLHLEPSVNPNAVGALWAPTAGKIAPTAAVIAIVENAVENGVRLYTEARVTGVKVEGGEVKGVETSRGFFEADIVVNAAGLYADEISRMAGVGGFTIRPRKGQYCLFDERAEPKVRRILHPTPTPKTKGVYVITTVPESRLMVGPTAEDLPPGAKEDTSTTREGIEYVLEWGKRLVRELPSKSMIIRTFAGLRPEPPNGRWIIKAYDDPWGFVDVAGIRSPGFTAAPAIAHYVRELIEEKLGVRLVEKRRWNPYRRAIRRFRDLPLEEQRRLVREDPRYGNVVCMCECVTEAEVLEAIERMRRIGVRTITLDGVKFRTFSMFGPCQGSFCRIRVALIIARETGVPLWRVTQRGPGTEYGIGDVKVLLRGEKGAG